MVVVLVQRCCNFVWVVRETANQTNWPCERATNVRSTILSIACVALAAVDVLVAPSSPLRIWKRDNEFKPFSHQFWRTVAHPLVSLISIEYRLWFGDTFSTVPTTDGAKSTLDSAFSEDERLFRIGFTATSISCSANGFPYECSLR